MSACRKISSKLSVHADRAKLSCFVVGTSELTSRSPHWLHVCSSIEDTISVPVIALGAPTWIERATLVDKSPYGCWTARLATMKGESFMGMAAIMLLMGIGFISSLQFVHSVIVIRKVA